MTLSASFSKLFPDIHQALGETNTQQLLASMSTIELPARRKLIRDRMPVDSLYFLVEGDVAISVEEGGRQISWENWVPVNCWVKYPSSPVSFSPARRSPPPHR